MEKIEDYYQPFLLGYFLKYRIAHQREEVSPLRNRNPEWVRVAAPKGRRHSVFYLSREDTSITE